MALPIHANASGGTVHVGPPGLYDVVIAGVKKDELTSTFGTNDVCRFQCRLLQVLDSDGEPVVIDAIANWLLSPMSKLWAWLENLGMHPQVGFDLDLEDAIGRQAVASIIDGTSSKDGSLFSKVDALYAPKRGAMAPGADLLTPQGGVNWTAFWAECGRRHITREMVVDALGGDINSITIMPVNDVLQILEDLRGI